MKCFVKIGDTALVIDNSELADLPEQHVCTALDQFSGTCQNKLVASEPEAIAVLQGFLNIDGPTGRFAELFDHPDFRP